LKEEALDRTLWRTRFGRGYGPVVKQTTEWMNEWVGKVATGHGFLRILRSSPLPIIPLIFHASFSCIEAICSS
jgi:hypothetical protein